VAKKIGGSHKLSQSKNRLKAARLLAEDRQTDEQIAAECGIKRRTLARWKLDEAFAAEVDSFRKSAAEGATKATEEKAFNTTDRLIELARLKPDVTNGTIGGQVKACLGIAQIRGEIINRHEDVTPVTPAERKKKVMGLLREGAQRIEKVQ
jgi:transcriptional regulator with XRE-family HTH domain